MNIADSFIKYLKNNKWIILILLSSVVIFICLFTLIENNPDNYMNDPLDYNVLGHNIVEFKAYTVNPKNNNYLTAYRPPGYPFFIALNYLICVDNWKLVIMTQFFLFLVSLLLFFNITKRYFGANIAYISTAIYAFNPAIILINNSFWTESFALSLIVFSVFLYHYPLKLKRWWRIILVSLSGLLFGWAVLTRPTFLIYIMILIIGLIISLFSKRFNKILFLFLIFALIPIVGWSVRSSIVTKSFVVVSTNGGLNYMLGNNPYNINGRASSLPPKEYLESNGISSESNETQKDKIFTKMAFKWISENPIIFLRMSFSKIQFLFVSDPYIYGNEYTIPKLAASFIRILKMCYYSVFLILSMLGLYYFNEKKLLLWFFPYFFMIIMTFSDSRFAIPLYMPMSILSAYALINIRGIVKNHNSTFFIIILFIWQFVFYFPYIEQECILMKYYFKGVLARYVVMSNNDGYFITDSDSNNPSCIYKNRSKFGDVRKQVFFNNKGDIISEQDLINGINSGKIYTDLMSVFSNIDKELYPNLSGKNYFRLYKVFVKPVFRIIPERLLSKELKVVTKNGYLSERPGVIKKVIEFDTEVKSDYYFSLELEPTSQILINLDEENIVVENYPAIDRTFFKIIVSSGNYRHLVVSIVNNYAFENLHGRSIFSKNSKFFQINGGQVNQIYMAR